MTPYRDTPSDTAARLRNLNRALEINRAATPPPAHSYSVGARAAAIKSIEQTIGHIEKGSRI